MSTRPWAAAVGLAGGALLWGPAAHAQTPMYQIRPRDTLDAIANRFHVSVADLVAWNHLADPNRIETGAWLVVGPPDPAPAAPTGPSRYVVQPGDTLSAIAARFGTTVAALAAANHLADPNLILAGQVLTVPGPAAVSAAAAAPAATTTSATYVVQPGDTLSAIAARFGTTVAALAAANGLANPNRILVGQTLRVPAAPAPGALATASASAAPAPAAPDVSLGQAVTRLALEEIGAPYAWGGSTPSGFDCSGLVQWVFAQYGVDLPRTSWAQFDVGTPVSWNNLEPGDLVFFSTYAPGASHVGIYVGADGPYARAFVAADNPATGVILNNLDGAYWRARFVGARRVAP
ncbi:MAG: LysM peptidoglycan-binding domain-containing protein [Actinomycetia bacterium]|nr:LysM peptidoglycan-binding domain-containing protein [Actinomycetes bacterium]